MKFVFVVNGAAASEQLHRLTADGDSGARTALLAGTLYTALCVVLQALM